VVCFVYVLREWGRLVSSEDDEEVFLLLFVLLLFVLVVLLVSCELCCIVCDFSLLA
jgi:hypothetical protein